MNENKDIIEEYFNPETTVARREEIRALASKLDKGDDSNIILFLSEEIQKREGVEKFKIQLNQLKDPAKSKFSVFKIAATITFFLILSALLFNRINTLNNKGTQLYLAYYKPYPEEVSRNNQTSSLNDFYLFYHNGQYIQAEKEIRNLLSADSENVLKSLYLGNVFLLQERFNDALIIFNEIEDDSQYYEHVIWYKAMALIRLENFDEATLLLELLIKEKSIYSKYAGELLDEISE